MRSARLLVSLMLLAGLASAEDPYLEKYKQFFKEDIAGKWAREELSEQRTVMVRGFEKHDVGAAAVWLIEDVVAKDQAADVVREAVRVLGTYKRPSTVEAMATAWQKKLKRSWEARALTLLAFAKTKHESAARTIALGLADREPRVLIAACSAAGAGRRIDLREAVVKLLKHKLPAVRGAAALALGEMGGEESLPDVFRVFCTDLSHRVRYDAWLALKKLTLEETPCYPESWRDFWTKRSSEVAEEAPNPWGKTFPRIAPKVSAPSRFFDIPLLGDRICFVIDISLDMANAWKIDIKGERAKKPEERTPNFFSVKTRWGLVTAHLKQCLKLLPPDVEVAFVFFNHNLYPYPEKPKYLKNKAKTQKDLARHLDDEIKTGGSTAMYEGLKRGWGFLKEGHPDQNFLKGCDTLVFVTDGRPTDGELKNREDRLRDEVWRVAVPRGLRVHTVGVHFHAYELLKAMAKDSGGLYVHAQEHGDTTEPQDLDFWPAKKKAFEEARKKKKAG